ARVQHAVAVLVVEDHDRDRLRAVRGRSRPRSGRRAPPTAGRGEEQEGGRLQRPASRHELGILARAPPLYSARMRDRQRMASGPVLRLLRLAATALFLAGLAGDRVPLLRGPAPYPPEWQWPQRDVAASGPLWPALAAAAALMALLAASGSARARTRP